MRPALPLTAPPSLRRRSAICTVPRVLGETNHVIGQDGAKRAKVWLEKTGRVEVPFSRYEVNEAKFLTYTKVDGNDFSFDIGGFLKLEAGTVQFHGEVKKVSGEAGQGGQYQDHLAKCYRATVVSGMPYHFMWITWHPFSQTNWAKLCDSETIQAAVTAQKDAYCGDGDVDVAVCDLLAERLWLIVLSDRQETLSMSDAMLGALRNAVTQGVAP